MAPTAACFPPSRAVWSSLQDSFADSKFVFFKFTSARAVATKYVQRAAKESQRAMDIQTASQVKVCFHFPDALCGDGVLASLVLSALPDGER